MQGRERMIAAIPQRHLGMLYRSRTEARWAQFFHVSRIPVVYEEEGYQTDVGWYVPDFRLVTVARPTFFEVKPTAPTEDEYDKLSAVARGLSAHVFVAHGSPSCDCRIEKVLGGGSRQEWFFTDEHEGGPAYLVDNLWAHKHAIALRAVKGTPQMDGLGAGASLDAARRLRFGHEVEAPSRQPNAERKVMYHTKMPRVVLARERRIVLK